MSSWRKSISSNTSPPRVSGKHLPWPQPTSQAGDKLFLWASSSASCTDSSPGIYGVHYCKADPGIIYHTCISSEESRYGQIQLFWSPLWTEGCFSRKEHMSTLNNEASIFLDGLAHLLIQYTHPNFNHHPSIISSRTVIIFQLFSQLIQYLPNTGEEQTGATGLPTAKQYQMQRRIPDRRGQKQEMKMEEGKYLATDPAPWSRKQPWPLQPVHSHREVYLWAATSTLHPSKI